MTVPAPQCNGLNISAALQSRNSLYAALSSLDLKGRLVTTEQGTLQFSSLQCRDSDKLINAIVDEDILANVMPRSASARLGKSATYRPFERPISDVIGLSRKPQSAVG